MTVPPEPHYPQEREQLDRPGGRATTGTRIAVGALLVVLLVALVAWLASRDDVPGAPQPPTSTATPTTSPTPDPTTVAPDPTTSEPASNPALDPEHAEALARMRALAESPAGEFPVCGAPATLPEDPGPLALDPVAPLTLASGERTEATVDLVATADRVTGGASGSGAVLLVLFDGVVVGGQWTDPESLDPVDLGPGESQETRMLVSAVVCGTGEGGTGPELALPPGDYDAVAVLDVLLESVTSDGTTTPTTDLVHAVSGVTTVTVE